MHRPPLHTSIRLSLLNGSAYHRKANRDVLSVRVTAWQRRFLMRPAPPATAPNGASPKISRVRSWHGWSAGDSGMLHYGADGCADARGGTTLSPAPPRRFAKGEKRT